MRELRVAPRVVVVGGGISGLALAHALGDRAQVTVLEASARAGGNVRTELRDGMLLDVAADSWVANKPQATALARALGLGDRLIETVRDNRRVYVVSPRGALVPLPEGLVLGVPTRLLPFLRSPLLGVAGKARAALDLLLPAGFGRERGDDDESVGRWFERRFGREVVEAIAAPLLGGLYSGDVSQLSLRATFPQLAALEATGSVIRAARAIAPKRVDGAPPPSAFVSLRGGVGTLIDALLDALAERVRLRTKVTGVAWTEDSWTIAIDGGAPLHADHLVVTGTAHGAASLLAPLDAPLADELRAIPYGSAATVFLAWPRADVPHPLDATGYIVTKAQRAAAIASTWISSKWADRAPADRALLRVFFGGDDVERDDDALISLAREELRRRIGVGAAPSFTSVERFRRASPQPQVGHLARVARIDARVATHRGLHLLGSAYHGVGIADCVRQAGALADAILQPSAHGVS
ncbi:MAG: protoporphyrinogen oxidase [Polyangiales bacterium]